MPDTLLLTHQMVRFHADRRQLLRGRQPIGGAQINIVELLAFRSPRGYEKLVQLVR